MNLSAVAMHERPWQCRRYKQVQSPARVGSLEWPLNGWCRRPEEDCRSLISRFQCLPLVPLTSVPSHSIISRSVRKRRTGCVMVGPAGSLCWGVCVHRRWLLDFCFSRVQASRPMIGRQGQVRMWRWVFKILERVEKKGRRWPSSGSASLFRALFRVFPVTFSANNWQ